MVIGNTSQIREPRFWSSWKGSIIRAIVLDGLYQKQEILKRTQLEKEQFEQALNELFQNGFLNGTQNDRFWVNSHELYNEYREFYKELQEKLVGWVNDWRQKKLGALWKQTKPSHFFLEDKLLYDFSEKLIGHSSLEILVANPFVQRCHLSNSLMEISKKGINVKLITRSFSKPYINEFSDSRVSTTYDESVHAKIILVDRCVGIVSSMNLFANSSGGGSWEAGLVTTGRNAVQSISRSVLNKI